MRYWLIKSEPSEYSFDDLLREPGSTARWDGVRNYQARNYLRQMRRGDRVLFYHSSIPAPAIVGLATVAAEAYPDPTQYDEASEGHDPKARPGQPRWFAVDIRADAALARPITRGELRTARGLASMALLQRGQRLSVMPIAAAEWRRIVALATESR
ncbi:MAG: EVE domain-containing protein [Acidobacteriota bacterium]|nr:MAG: EVE domain-containing protein [Acidobacteriota bacterium]